MPIQYVFWTLMLFAVFFWLRGDYTAGQPYPFYRGVGWLLIIALFGILGWAEFGAAVTRTGR